MMCLHFFDEMFGSIKGIAYLCNVDGKSITILVTLNYEDYGNNSELQEMQICGFLHKRSVFMLQNLVINRNFAIFAARLAYEVQ